MRWWFNWKCFWERTKGGDLTAVIQRSVPSRIESGQPAGTATQSVSYRDANNLEVARVHQYLLPSGKLGGWGRPDPKEMVHNGILYRLNKQNAQLALASQLRAFFAERGCKVLLKTRFMHCKIRHSILAALSRFS